MLRKRIVLKIIPFIVLLLAASTASAHRATVFAWVEGDTVHTESKFSGGKRAQNCTIEVFDGQGDKLLEGETNENGEFSFKPPRKTELKIVLKAGMGHLGSWTIPADEFDTGVVDSGESGNSPESSGVSEQNTTPATRNPEIRDPEPSVVKTAELQRMIEKALDKKLEPVIAKINRSLEPDTSPSISDILGGIGYIAGLAGVGAYVNYRKKSKEAPSP